MPLQYNRAGFRSEGQAQYSTILILTALTDPKGQIYAVPTRDD